jgi:hypothetical protein
MVENVGPVLAAPGASPAEASRPEPPLEDGRWHSYESNPVPWWVALVWLWFFAFGIVYLLKSMIH